MERTGISGVSDNFFPDGKKVKIDPLLDHIVRNNVMLQCVEHDDPEAQAFRRTILHQVIAERGHPFRLVRRNSPNSPDQNRIVVLVGGDSVDELKGLRTYDLPKGFYLESLEHALLAPERTPGLKQPDRSDADYKLRENPGAHLWRLPDEFEPVSRFWEKSFISENQTFLKPIKDDDYSFVFRTYPNGISDEIDVVYLVIEGDPKEDDLERYQKNAPRGICVISVGEALKKVVEYDKKALENGTPDYLRRNDI